MTSTAGSPFGGSQRKHTVKKLIVDTSDLDAAVAATPNVVFLAQGKPGIPSALRRVEEAIAAGDLQRAAFFLEYVERRLRGYLESPTKRADITPQVRALRTRLDTARRGKVA